MVIELACPKCKAKSPRNALKLNHEEWCHIGAEQRAFGVARGSRTKTAPAPQRMRHAGKPDGWLKLAKQHKYEEGSYDDGPGIAEEVTVRS